MFVGKTDVEAEAPILWPPHAKNWLIQKDPDAGKRGWERMRWQHWLNGHEFEQALGDGEGQRSLAWCSPWSCKELDMIEWLNNFLLGFPGWVVVKNLPVNAGGTKDPGLIAESERFPGIGNGNPFQYSCLENFIDRGSGSLQSMGSTVHQFKNQALRNIYVFSSLLSNSDLNRRK